MHDGICDNPLDMSLSKYGPNRKFDEQRDMNPLGFSLKKQTAFMLRQQAEELLGGKKPDVEQAKKDNADIINRYSKYACYVCKCNIAFIRRPLFNTWGFGFCDLL